MKQKIVLSLMLSLVANFSLFAEGGIRIENRLLTWEDFKASPDPSLNYDAYTIWYLMYTYPAPTWNGNVGSVQPEVWCELSSKSWVRWGVRDEEKDRLLNHEQGHFNICLITAKKLRKAISGAKLRRADYKNQISGIYDSTMRASRPLELRYDKETNHMYNLKMQTKWDAFFAKELAD